MAATGSEAGEPADDWSRPQQSVDVGGDRKVHIRCAGRGSPTVVLTAGLGESGDTWRTVMPAIAERTQVCAWDRAGMGFSGSTTVPQNAANTTADLEATLRGANVAPPYVLVGHSLGSFESLMFAYRHREDVAGMVLVDPASPYQSRIFAEASPRFGQFQRRGLEQRNEKLRRCIGSLEKDGDSAGVCGPPSPGRSREQRIGVARSVLSLSEEMDQSSAQLIAAKRPLGNLPLIVLTAGKRPPPSPDLASENSKADAAWRQMHRDLAAQSRKGQNREVAGAGHYIHRDRPDVVLSAVSEVLANGRR